MGTNAHEDAAAYGDTIADIYDERAPAATAAEIEFLAALADGGRVLELGIGTGRVAVPLAARGLEVHGIEASERLVARLRAKPEATKITVTIGDIRAVEPDGEFALIYAIYDTFSMLPSQQDQLSCFRMVSAHLRRGGFFVIEQKNPVRLFDVPPVQMLASEGDAVWLAATRHDPVAQSFEQAQVQIGRNETRVYPVRGRYTWPSELDLMAGTTGLLLRERYGDWERQAFAASSQRFVSVYGAS